MWYTIILLSIALAVSVGFWVKADRMAAHYRRERDSANHDRDWAENNWIIAADNRELAASDLRKTRLQLAAARGQITKLRRKYGEIE